MLSRKTVLGTATNYGGLQAQAVYKNKGKHDPFFKTKNARPMPCTVYKFQ